MAFDNQFGYAAETTYGTRVAPTRFVDFTEESIQRQVEHRESAGMRAGTIVRRGETQTVADKGANGTVSHEIGLAAFGLLFKHMLRKTPTITQPAVGPSPTVYEQAFVLGEEVLSLTAQVGRQGADGTVYPFDYLGTVVEEWTISQELDAYAKLELKLDAKTEKTDQSLATASYSSERRLFHDGHLAVTVNGSAFKPRSISLTGNNGLKLDRYFLQGSTLKEQPKPGDWPVLSGTMAGEFTDLTAYSLFTAGTLVPIVFDWVGPIIEDAYQFELKITLNGCRIDGETPGTSAPGILDQSVPFSVYDDGTNAPLALLYRTTDAAV